MGIDIEDVLKDSYILKKERNQINIREYYTKERANSRFSARFEYNGLEYYLIAAIPKTDFNYILENLFFY